MKMLVLSLISLISLCSVGLSQPPVGTGRAITRDNGSVEYYTTGGKWLGRSTNNASSGGGRTYYDGRGIYSKTNVTGNTERQTYSRQQKISQPNLTPRPRSHTMVSKPGSSVTGVGIYSTRKK